MGIAPTLDLRPQGHSLLISLEIDDHQKLSIHVVVPAGFEPASRANLALPVYKAGILPLN